VVPRVGVSPRTAVHVLTAPSSYIVSSGHCPAVNWLSHANPLSSIIGRNQQLSEDMQQVTLGIFPASNIFEQNRDPNTN
jgi:hypothetical protein